MKKNTFCFTVLSSIFLSGLFTQVCALPRFTLITGESCVSCHVNPTGGALRNFYGTQKISREELPMWTNDQFKFSTQLTPNITIGADARAQFLASDSLYNYTTNKPGSGGGALQPMQASLYVNANLTDNIGLYMKEDFVTQPGSFEFWGIARVLPNGGYIKAGTFQPAIGLHVDDHSSFTRSGDYTQNGQYWGFGLYPNSVSTGVEIGEYVSDFFICASITNGEFPNGALAQTAAFPNFTPNKTLTGRIEYTKLLTDDFAMFLGASGLANTSPTVAGNFISNPTRIYGGFAGIRVSIVTITADYEMGKNLVTGTSIIDSTTANALMAELAVKATQGLYGIVKYDSFAPDISNTTANKVSRWTIGAEWYPVNFVEIIPQVRFMKSTTTTEVTSSSNVSTTIFDSSTLSEFLIQIHFWL